MNKSELPDVLNRYFKMGCKSFTRHELLAYGGMDWHKVEDCLRAWESRGFIEVLKSLHEGDDGEVVVKIIHLIDETGPSFEPVTCRYEVVRPHVSKIREALAERIEVPFTDFERLATDKENIVKPSAAAEAQAKVEIQEQPVVVPAEAVPEIPKFEYSLPPVEIEPVIDAAIATTPMAQPEPPARHEIPELQFVGYLKCDLPLGYPFNTPLSQLFLLHIREHHRKDLIRQQFAFLCEAERLALLHPRIAYIAALKHEAVLNILPMESSRKEDIANKRLFKRCREKCKKLQIKCQAVLDRDTTHACERLVLLQSEAFKIGIAEKRLTAAIDAGFSALETTFDIPPKAPKPTILYSSIVFFGLSGLVCVIIGAAMGRNFVIAMGGLGLGLVGLGVVLVFTARKANVTAAEAILASWMADNHQVKTCHDSIHAMSAIPPKVCAGALQDLRATLEMLKALRAERFDLEARLIWPFVRDCGSPVDDSATVSSNEGTS